MTIDPQAQAVLDFWFAPAGADGRGARPEWCRKDPRFDRDIGERFGVPIARAVAGELRAWEDAGLARLLLLDQFTRNAYRVYRDTPAALGGDALALEAARRLRDSGAHLALPARRRAFVYLPCEHAEDGAMQALAVDLFAALERDAGGCAGMLDYARRQRDVIARFGRFPHCNRILGRISTPQELAFLAQPGAGF
ncbi:MAG: DUF924 family protein [Pseudomonadota bacterium]